MIASDLYAMIPLLTPVSFQKKNRIVILIYVLTVLVLLRAAKRLELLLADLLTDDDQFGRKCSEPVTICRREL